MRWAIIGTGTISRDVVADLKTCNDAEIVLVHSRTLEHAEAFAAEFDIPVATEHYEQALLDPAIDIVYIATPFATHHALGKKALLAGKNVLIEKPMAMNASEVNDLFDLAEAQGVFLMEAMWMKFNPRFIRLMGEIASGRIGEVRNVRAAFSLPFPENHASRWRTDGSPGALLDQGIYPVTLAHTVLGNPTSVHAVGIVRPDGIDIAEHFTLEFDGGRFAQCASGMAEFTDLSAAVAGTAGWITLPEPFWAMPALSIHADDLSTIFRHPVEYRPEPQGNGYTPMLDAVNAAVETGLTEHPSHPRQSTVDVFTILDTIRTEITRGQLATTQALQP